MTCEHPVTWCMWVRLPNPQRGCGSIKTREVTVPLVRIAVAQYIERQRKLEHTEEKS